MSIKVYKRNNAGRRNMSVIKPEGVTNKKPEKALLTSLNKSAGRAGGKISVRHRGGGHKRRYRIIDFKQDKLGIVGKVTAIEKDPNRSALLALVVYADGEKRYILASEGMEVGKTIIADKVASFDKGNRMQLKNIPVGTALCNVELTIGKGGQLARSAGSSVLLMGLDGNKAQLKMASGEIRLINSDCFATIGQVSNFEHGVEKIGKAGRKRWLGFRPTVRGSAMNPVDHPHGGGEGRQGVGLKYPKTPWGKIALGKKTRNKKKYSNKFIVKRRTKK
ncbi:MAG: 50S ribosomal protein L2 [Candidatus Moranbacteria bacterium]|jgi:large subunit ribosomal protein L2|nr:50S ribosomal protein L2 [Candidatus Moranbacteria bacterium]